MQHHRTGARQLKAETLLLSLTGVQHALGDRVHLEAARSVDSSSLGNILRAASVDSAFRRFDGVLPLEGYSHPVAVSTMGLVFDSPQTAIKTYSSVAGAAHLRTQVAGCDVAVETTSGKGGLVSYWGFVHRDEAIIIVTLDTVDPQHVSVADLRSLVLLATDRLESALGSDA